MQRGKTCFGSYYLSPIPCLQWMGCTRGGFYTLNLERIPRIFELDSNALAITHQYREDGLFKTGRLSIVVIRQLTFVERKRGFDTRWSGTSSGISIEFT